MTTKVGGKIRPKIIFGVPEIDEAIHIAGAPRRLAKAKRSDSWKMAAAAACDRRLLIGKSKVFRSPK